MKQRLIVAAIGVPLTLAVILFMPAEPFGYIMYGLAGACCAEMVLSAGAKRWYAWACVLLIGVSFGCLATLRKSYGVPFTLLTFGCAYIGDAGAMLTGKFFGKRHPFPTVSPNKTVAGLIGGIIVPILFAAALAGFVKAAVPQLLAIGLILGLVAELGDLFFSYIKRKIGVKDYGKILGAHGGMLDRFDSMVFVAPVALGIYTIL